MDFRIENEEDYEMQINIIDFELHLNADINREINRNERLQVDDNVIRKSSVRAPNIRFKRYF